MSRTDEERVLAVARHTAFVWRDDADAWQWLITPHPKLGGQRPIDAAEEENGEQKVMAVLDSIQDGLPV